MAISEADREAFAKRFAYLRHRGGFTQTEIGRKLGMSPTIAYYWESGKVYPKPGAIMRLADLFEVSETYLVTGEISETDTKVGPAQPLVEAIANARQKI